MSETWRLVRLFEASLYEIKDDDDGQDYKLANKRPKNPKNLD